MNHVQKEDVRKKEKEAVILEANHNGQFGGQNDSIFFLLL